MNETITNMMERRSIRKFKGEPVRDEDLKQILTAGTYAPTGMNKQAPLIVVIKDKTLIWRLEKMNSLVMGNEGGSPFYGAPTLLIVFSDTSASTHVEDGSLVIGNMLNAAHSLGVGSCWIHRAKEMFQSPEGKALMKEWGIDDRYVGVGNVILGYPNGPSPDAKPRKENYVITIE